MTRAILTFLLFLMVQIIGSAVALLFGNLDRIGQGTPLIQLPVSPEASGISLLLFEFMLCLGLGWYYSWTDRRTSPFPDGAAPNRRPVSSPVRISAGSSAMAIVGTLCLSMALSALLTPLHLDDQGAQLLFDGMKHNALCLLLLCFVGPLCEELVFRRGVLEGLMQSGWHPLWAVMVSSLAFALVHGNVMQMIPAFVVGLVLGLCFLRTGNLRLCLPVHVANNVLAVVLMFFPGIEARVGAFSATWCVIGGLVLFAVGVILIWRSLRLP